MQSRSSRYLDAPGAACATVGIESGTNDRRTPPGLLEVKVENTLCVAVEVVVGECGQPQEPSIEDRGEE